MGDGGPTTPSPAHLPNGARLWQWRRTAATATYPHLPSTPRQVLSLDALNGVEARAEGEEWVWGGYDLLDEGGGRSLWDRALLFLSPG